MTIRNPQSEISNALSRPCRACNCPLVMAPNIETGKNIPLDRRSPVYVLFRDERGELKAWNVKELLATVGELQLKTAEGMKRMDVVGVHVTHFASCPKAGQFSARK